MNNNPVLVSIVLIAAFCCIGFIGYGLVTSHSRERLAEMEKQERIDKDASRLYLISDCQRRARDNYTLTWNGMCVKSGLKEGCLLQSRVADAYNKQLSEELDRCMKL